MTDLFNNAEALEVIDVWKPGNPTGWVTPKVLYDPHTKAPDGNVKAPTLGTVTRWVDHGTVGTNTLQFWGTGGSVASGAWTLAHYLVPHDTTVYADGKVHDTTNVVFKMVPDGYGCNHTGECSAGVSNTNALGVEYESLQNGTADITENQLIKGALLFAQAAAAHNIPDWYRVMHGIVGIPWPRRTDPFAGRFDIAHSWELVQAIRRDSRIWALWGMTQPKAA